MKKHILLNSIFLLSITSISGLPRFSALAQIQSSASSIQYQKVTIPHSSAINVSLPKVITFDTGHKKNSPTVALIVQRLLDSSGHVINPVGVDCNNIPLDAVLETPVGFRPVSIYCQAQFNERQQSAVRLPTVTQLPWQKPYWQNGHVCRERGTDTVCLTPQEATNLRWLTPSR